MGNKFGARKAAEDARDSEKNVRSSWHAARDDSGRDDSRYGRDTLSDQDYRDQARQELSDSMRNAGITDIMSLPKGYKSDFDR